MTEESESLEAQIAALRDEVEGLHQLVYLMSAYGHGLRYIVRDGQKILQHFNNITWADVPTILNPSDSAAYTLDEVLGFEPDTDHPKV